MKMLRHIPTGRVYVYNAQLARAEGMEEFDDPDFGVTVTIVQEDCTDIVQEDCTESVRSLDEMTRDELIAVAEAEERARGDKMNLSRMKKADLIAYITGQPEGEGA